MRVCVSALVLVALGAGCGKHFGPRPYPEPGADALIAYLTGMPTRVTSLRAETRSDARIGKDRANVEVSILALRRVVEREEAETAEQHRLESRVEVMA